MKVIDVAAAKSGGKLPGVAGRALGGLGLASSRQMAEAEEKVLGTLGKVLNNNFIALRHIPGVDAHVALLLVLVGPPGVWAISVNPERGIYRASETQWEVMDSKGKSFRQAKTNLLALAGSRAEAIQAFLAEKGLEGVKVEPAVILSHPGAHVEVVRPAVRVIMEDAVARYAANLLQAAQVPNAERTQMIVEALSSVADQLPKDGEEPDEIHDQYSFKEKKAPKPKKKAAAQPHFATVGEQEPEMVKRLWKRVPFTPRQWLLLGLLLLLNILLLAALIFYIVIAT